MVRLRLLHLVNSIVSCSSLRTASELKIKRAQSNSGSTTTTHHDATRGFGGIGIDMSSGTADEAADRALTSVARKLDKALSVEYTVNELIAEATDPVNLATIYHGAHPCS
jgi:ataxia telangiectasia mutated family protein